MRITENYTFFYGAQDVLSNFHLSPIGYRGVDFNCVEQFFMYSKAKMFGDELTAKKILLEKVPFKQKQLGRQVKGYDDLIWSEKSPKIMLVASREKYSQNEILMRLLLNTKGTLLVEASERDYKWGVGLSEDNDDILESANWKGQNLLGNILTEVREDFILLGVKISTNLELNRSSSITSAPISGFKKR
jgi:ribA/ribD-fused uncharacterized protein